MRTSFAPKDFGAGRWEGGEATITAPHFEYRTANFGKGDEKIVCLSLSYLDNEGGEHIARFDVGNTVTANGEQILVIRDAADDDANEAETGPSFSHIDPQKAYRPSAKSEFGTFCTMLVSAGFSEAKLNNGDISILDGAKVRVTPKARKEGDKYPLLVVTELVGGSGTSKTAAPKTAAAKATATKAAATAAPDADEATTDSARDFVMEVVLGTTDPVKVAKLVTSAMATFKDQKELSAAVVKLVQNADFHASNSGYWSYDAKAKTVQQLS